LELSQYVVAAMKKVQPKGYRCILAPHQYGGLAGHWICWMIFPQDGRAVVLDSLTGTNPYGYRHFESVLKL